MKAFDGKNLFRVNLYFFESNNQREKLFPQSFFFKRSSEVFLSTSIFSSKSVRDLDDLCLT